MAALARPPRSRARRADRRRLGGSCARGGVGGRHVVPRRGSADARARRRRALAAPSGEGRRLERARRLRAARGGAGWWIEWLRCRYCTNRDQARLGALVSEGVGERRKVDTCPVCRHYVKTVTTLVPTAPADVAIE